MSIRLRLTVIFSAILAFTLIVFSVSLFVLQSQLTLNMMENDLKRIINPIANRFLFALGGNDRPFRPAPETAGTNPPGLLWLDEQPFSTEEFRTRDLLHILDVDGNLMASADDQEATNYPISQEGLQTLHNGEPWAEIVDAEEERVLVFNHPASNGESIVAIVQVSRSLADRDRSMQSLGITLIVGSVLTTLVAFGGGWFLAGTALKPVKGIMQNAHDIGQARDFSARVQYKGPEDELGQLAMTFNEMLAQLQDGYQQVAHALQVQRDFVADVSHELRTPLTTIRGNLDLLKRDPPLPQTEQDDILNDLSGESERLSRLVNELLILARADAGHTFPCHSVDIKLIVEDALRQMRRLAPACTILTEGDEIALASANEDALKQVVLILLDNAIKHAYCPITINFSQNEENINIFIRDSGPGMPAEQVERIFNRFYRGDESRSSPGFGLGLAIARTLVEAQHGTIEVQSEVGTGSIFIVTLPRTQ